MKETIAKAINSIVVELNIPGDQVTVVYPTHFSLGDYSTNIALVAAKHLKKNPLLLAEELAQKIERISLIGLEKIVVAPPGFINFFINKEFFKNNIENILKKRQNFGKNNLHHGKLIVIEHTDPNPFKEFHIGHLMPNVIGESFSRFLEASGAKVKRVCYQGDVGLHVAKSVWGMKMKKDLLPIADSPLSLKASFLGECYAFGATAYNAENGGEDEKIKQEIEVINKKIYTREDEEINLLYDQGKKWSLEYFESLYKKLGTKFDDYFFESDTSKIGEKIVKENVGNIFEESDGAIVFKAEKYDSKLHTRVFISNKGIPIYEAKELGLSILKEEKYAPDMSIVVTGNEINEYFKVLLKALELLSPEIAQKTIHISHGMLRLPSGKMSSRTGDVITVESLIDKVKIHIAEKIKERGLDNTEEQEILNDVAIAAIKYSILKQSPGSNIIFDLEKSLSLEGDSGPYLQYARTRARAVLEKAKLENLSSSFLTSMEEWSTKEIERLLLRFPEIVLSATQNFEPHSLVIYLVSLASSFNSFYGEEKIINKTDSYSEYRLSITESFKIVMENGLNLLGISAPDKM